MKIAICALECEARPIINKLKLRKVSLLNSFEIFANEDYLLIISGVGILKASIAASSLITKLAFTANLNKLLLCNIGVCGAKKELALGEVLFPHTICHETFKRKYYQEFFTKQNFKPASLLTSNIPVINSEERNFDCYDMEAYGIFEAANLTLKSSQIFCVKIVSDHCSGGALNKNDVSELIQGNSSEILDFIDKSYAILNKKEILSKEEVTLLGTIKNNLRLTVYQGIEMEKSAVSFKIRHNSSLDVLHPFTSERPASKQDSKAIFLKIQDTLNV